MKCNRAEFQQALKRPFFHAVERARKPYFTRIPALLRYCGSRIYSPVRLFHPRGGASTCLPRAEFILRGCRFATITVNFPISSVAERDLIPEKHMRVFPHRHPTSVAAACPILRPPMQSRSSRFEIDLGEVIDEITPSASGSFTFAAFFDVEAEAAAAGQPQLAPAPPIRGSQRSALRFARSTRVISLVRVDRLAKN